MGPSIERRCQMSNPLGIGVIKCNPPKFINFRPAEVWCKKMLDQLINDCHVMTRAELILSKRGYWGHWTFLWRVVFFEGNFRPKEKGDPGPSFGERWSYATRMIPRKRRKENLGTFFLNVPWILKPPVYEETPFISFFFSRGGEVHSFKTNISPWK